MKYKNILAPLEFLVSYGSATLIGLAVGSWAAFNITSLNVLPDVTAPVENSVDLSLSVDTIATLPIKGSALQTSPKDTTTTPKPEETTPTVNVTTTQSSPKAAAPSPKTTASQPTEYVPNQTDVVYNTAYEWQETVLGTCPSTWPASPFNSTPARRLALGIRYAKSTQTEMFTPEALVESIWEDSRTAYPTYKNGSYIGNLTHVGYENTYANAEVELHLSGSPLTFTWTSPYTQTSAKQAEYNSLVKRMTEYFYYLENAYNSKCPND